MLLALLVAVASDVRVAVSAGAGTAFGYAGARVELSIGQVGFFVGAGWIAAAGGDAEWATGRWMSRAGTPLAGGLRYAPNPESGPFLAATMSHFPYTYPSDDGHLTLLGTRWGYTLTGGYRLFLGAHFFLEGALGAGVAKAVDPGPTSYLGTIGPSRNEFVFQPDGAVAVGVRF